jgi:hypothetical protein
MKSVPSSDSVVIYTPNSEKRANPSKDEPQPEKKAKLTAFWVPGVTPEAGPALLKRPSSDTKCPDGNHNIKLKQLVSLKFTANKSGGESLYECAVCSKTFVKAIKASAIKKCGHVVCQTCMGPIKKDCSCPICSVAFKEGDVINLSTGGNILFRVFLGRDDLRRYLTCQKVWRRMITTKRFYTSESDPIICFLFCLKICVLYCQKGDDDVKERIYEVFLIMLFLN